MVKYIYASQGGYIIYVDTKVCRGEYCLDRYPSKILKF